MIPERIIFVSRDITVLPILRESRGAVCDCAQQTVDTRADRSSKVVSTTQRVRPSTDVLNHQNFALLFKTGGQALLLPFKRLAICSQMCQGKHNLEQITMIRFVFSYWPEFWRRNQQDGPQGCEAEYSVNKHQIFEDSSSVGDPSAHLPRSKESEDHKPVHLPSLGKGMNWMRERERKKGPRS